MGTAADDLDATVNTARIATRRLLGAMTAHHMVPGIVNLNLVPHWPAPVQVAYHDWEDQIIGIARLLARRRGVEPADLGDNDSTALLLRACVLGLDLDD